MKHIKITSRKNEKITLYRELLRSAKSRRENNMFVTEGKKLCEEAISSGFKPVSALFSQSAVKKYYELYKIIENGKTSFIDEINGDLCEYISDTKSPQGVFAAFEVLDKTQNFDKIYNCTRVIILDRLQDPGNLGAIIRTSDAFGIDAVVVSGDTADIFSPKVLRSAAGSAFRVPVFTAELKTAALNLKQNGFACFAAVLGKDTEKLGEIIFPPKTAVIIGNEGSGINADLIPLCKKLYIPINRAESLNAAVAASLIIYEMNKTNPGNYV